MDFSAGSIITSFIVGSTGFVLFVFGRKQSRFLHMIVGAALCIYPLFISNWIVSAAIAAVLLIGLTVMVRFGA
ncbi:MAG: hypothetical protein IPK60_12855 [Sandaracinaceae bacterium]|nr:hypothetical protein [Sandaracinaceae bacterium]